MLNVQEVIYYTEFFTIYTSVKTTDFTRSCGFAVDMTLLQLEYCNVAIRILQR